MKRVNSSVWVNDNHLQWNYSHCPSTSLMIPSFNSPSHYLLFHITMNSFWAASALCHSALCTAFKGKSGFLCCWNRKAESHRILSPLTVMETFHFCLILLQISWFIFFFLFISSHLFTPSLHPRLSFPLTFSCFLSPSSSLSLCPPSWPRCFVSMLFSLTVSVARLLCIPRERTLCLPSPNPRPLHNYGRPWRCTGRLTPASSWCERWQARRGSRSLSIPSRQLHGQSRLTLWPVVFIKASVPPREDCC